MGVVVNGPCEAREADVGVAGGRGLGILFAKGRMLGKVAEENLVSALLQEVDRWVEQYQVKPDRGENGQSTERNFTRKK